MRSLSIVECKRCGQQYVAEGTLAFSEQDKISLIIKFVPKCSECLKSLSRSTGGPNRKIGPGTKFHP